MTEYVDMVEEVSAITKDDVKLWLSDSTAIVTFEKTDGSLREMNATLQPSYLPEVNEKSTKKPRKENPNVVAVWDVDKDAWRSFRIDSIKEFLVE